MVQEIEMSEYDAEAYEKMWRKVEKLSNQLKIVFDSLQAKEKERQWTKHQISGDFDDAKLIEAVTGEKTVYRWVQEFFGGGGGLRECQANRSCHRRKDCLSVSAVAYAGIFRGGGEVTGMVSLLN